MLCFKPINYIFELITYFAYFPLLSAAYEKTMNGLKPTYSMTSTNFCLIKPGLYNSRNHN